MTRPTHLAAGAMLLLMAAACGGTERPASASEPGSGYRAGSVLVSGVVAPQPAGDAPVAVYLTIANDGDEADTLVAVASGAGDASLHTQEHDAAGGTMRMTELSHVAVPAHATYRLAPGGDHVMITGLTTPLAVGDTLPLVLTFRRAGPLPVAAHVLTYAALEQALDSTAHAGY